MPVRRPPLTTLTATAATVLLLAAAAAASEPATPAPESAKPEQAPAAAPAAAADTAVELPTFRFGLWEFRRTLMRADAAKPQVSTIRKCADPGADMREKMEDLKKKDCQFAPLRHSGDRYISSWICQTRTGAMRFRDVLQPKDPNSYQVVSETRSAQRATQQKIEATRIGECPGMGSGAPLTPTTPKRPGGHP